VHASLDSLLSPYLTPDQALLLRYEGALPPALLAELEARLRGELSALRAFVPEPLARDPEAFLRRGGRFWEGTLLCADLSGFTAVAEDLTAHGLLGIETLRNMLNEVFDALLQELHAYGGTVLKFGGDAITCFFDAAALGPSHSGAACAAALGMQRRMAAFDAYPACGRAYQLRLRVGVHSGRPFVTAVSAPERREVVAVGRAVNRTAALQEQAAPGEVLVSPEVLAALPSAESAPQGGGRRLLAAAPLAPMPAPPLPPLPAGGGLAGLAELAARIANLRPFLPASLPSSLLPAEAQSAGEFRSVSAVFVNVASLGGVLALLEELERPADEILNTYFAQVHGVVQRYGGVLNKFDISSAGDKLLVIFGAPVAHEDDPLRAVEAALELSPAIGLVNEQLRRLLDDDLLGRDEEAAPGADALWRTIDLSLRQRVGVATGTVYAGTVGSSRRREYTVIGQTVNLAARLMAVAEPGQVLLAPATARAVGEAVALQPLPPSPLKGFGQPVAPALALRLAPPPPLAGQAITPLVGRGRELALLRELAPAALGGAGRVVAICGDAGMGKSRLVAEFWGELDGEPARRIALSGRVYGQRAPYGLVRDLLAQLFALPADDAPEALRAAVREMVAATAPVFAPLTPLLGSVFAGPDLDARTVGARDPQPHFAVERLPLPEQRERLHDLLITLVVEAIKERPLVLLIDDLHWADDSSLELVQQLAQLGDTLPLLLLLSYRAPMLAEAPWLDLPHTSVLELEGLGKADSLELLGRLLEGVPTAAFEPVLERAQGSPAFLEAAVRHLIDRGGVARDAAGRWQLREPLTEAYVPEALESALAAQLDQLDEATRELLQVMAVIGTHVPYQVLAGVYSQARQPARRLLELVRAGFLETDEQEGRSGFRFRQALLREVTYRSILYAQRWELHRRVAERIELVFAAQIEQYAAELAYHYGQARDDERACRYALQAARSSRRRYALPEALACYAQVRELTELHPGVLGQDEALAALEELADVEVLAGRYDEAGALYGRLLAEDGAARATLRTAVLARKLGGVHEQQAQFDEALTWLHRARRIAEAAGGAPEAAALEVSRVCSAIGWVYFRRGEPEQAQRWLDEALSALSTAGDARDDAREERARVYNRLGGVAWMLGNLRAARIYVERSLADFTHLGDVPGRADAQNNLGILAEQLGDWEGAIASYSEALEVNQQTGRRRAAAMSRLNLGAAHLQLGACAEALPLLQQTADEARAVGDTVHEIMALRWLGRAQTRLGHFDAAAETLERALDGARRAELPLDQLDAHTALGELALARDDLRAARAEYRGGEALLRLVEQTTLEVALFLRFAARIEGAAGAASRGAALRAESQQIFSTLGIAAPPEFP
jgi:class 3 adenylate cyclase/tetratricopeptide (TPR) repeat protein